MAEARPNSPFHRKDAAHRQALGRRAEALACEFLRQRGFFVEALNVRYRVGEIDIVAREGSTLCFVEVRSTGSVAWGGPLATVTSPKQRRIVRAAQIYLQREPVVPEEIRFDVVAVDWSEGRKAKIELVRCAFTTDGLI